MEDINLPDNRPGNEKLFQTRAKLALPILIEYAKRKATITYSELAELIGMTNPRNLNRILDAIGSVINMLNAVAPRIPHVQSLVMNKQTGRPDEEVARHLEGFNPRFSSEEIRTLLISEQEKAFQFADWEGVKDELLARIQGKYF